MSFSQNFTCQNIPLETANYLAYEKRDARALILAIFGVASMKNCTDFYETPQIYFVANHAISAISFVYGLIIITALILKCPKQVKHTKWSFIYFQILFTFTVIESIEGLSKYK